MYHTEDTIAAIASAPGGAARGIVRTSGPDAIAVLSHCFRPRDPIRWAAAGTASVHGGTVALPDSPVAELPVDLYCWPTARSYTRQPAAEIHTIGSPPLVSAVLRAVCAAGARLAQPGEFTLRAFLAGRIDLTQAEAVLGIIDARGERQLRAALARLAGGLAHPLQQLREHLLTLLADLEAGLDFAEEDLHFITRERMDSELAGASAVIADIEAQLATRGRDDLVARAVLVGLPNVGKSSLFNAISAGSALVSHEPGTTRDYLTATLDLDGIGCRLIDTAGVEPGEGWPGIAAQAQRLATAEREHCEIRLLCLDAGRPLSDWELRELSANRPTDPIVVLTKCDRPRVVDLPCPAIETSSTSGLGLDTLRARLRQAVVTFGGDSSANLTAERCGDALRLAGEAIGRAGSLSRSMAGDEFVAALVRSALEELGKVVGAVYTDDILDRVFSRFCIGK